MIPDEATWSVRLRRAGPREVRAYARAATFSVGSPAGLRADDPHPSALELLLGALGGDVATGLTGLAARRGVVLHEVEVRLACRLTDPLAHLGVIGRSGDPGVARVTGTVHVATDADEDTVRGLWAVVCARAPVLATLSRAAEVALELRVTP